MNGQIGTNTPKSVPPRWGRPRFDPTQDGAVQIRVGLELADLSPGLVSSHCQIQKTREGCGCPKFLAGKVFRQISTQLENSSPIFRQHEMLSLPRFGHFPARKTAAGKLAAPSATLLDFLLRDRHSFLVSPHCQMTMPFARQVVCEAFLAMIFVFVSSKIPVGLGRIVEGEKQDQKKRRDFAQVSPLRNFATFSSFLFPNSKNPDRKNMTARSVTGFCVFLCPEIGRFSPHFGGDFLTKLHIKPWRKFKNILEIFSPALLFSVPCRG